MRRRALRELAVDGAHRVGPADRDGARPRGRSERQLDGQDAVLVGGVGGVGVDLGAERDDAPERAALDLELLVDAIVGRRPSASRWPESTSSRPRTSSCTWLGSIPRGRRARPRAAGRSRSRRRRRARSRRAGAARARDRARRRTARPSPAASARSWRRGPALGASRPMLQYQASRSAPTASTVVLMRKSLLALLVVLAAVHGFGRARTARRCGPATGPPAATCVRLPASGTLRGLAHRPDRRPRRRRDPARRSWRPERRPAATFASRRFAPPDGVTVDGVWLGRRVDGPGYCARTSTAELESLDQPRHARRRASARRPAASGVELGLRCDEDPPTRCDMTGASVDFRSAALAVRDDPAPTFGVSGIPGYAARRDVNIRSSTPATAGIGLASASATLGGVPMAVGRARPGVLQRALARRHDDRPAARRRLPGGQAHHAAAGHHAGRRRHAPARGHGDRRRGQRDASASFDLKVVNHPPVTVTPDPGRRPPHARPPPRRRPRRRRRHPCPRTSAS